MKAKSELGVKHQIIRLLWGVWLCFARPLPRSMGRRWKNWLLRLFGAKIHPTACVYSSARIYYPENLIMDAYASIGDDADIYNVDSITLKEGASISQRAYLCTASHDIEFLEHHLKTAPIVLERNAWVAADAFVGMGVTIGEGAVVGARAAVFKDVEQWSVVGGNPAKKIKDRKIKET